MTRACARRNGGGAVREGRRRSKAASTRGYHWICSEFVLLNVAVHPAAPGSR